MLGAKMGVEMATYNKYLENTVARGARGIPCSLSCGGRRYQLDSIMDQTKQPLQLRKCMPAATLLSGSWHITYNTTGHEWFLLTGKQSAFSKCTCQDFVALPNPDPVHLPQSCCDGLHLPPSCCDVPPLPSCPLASVSFLSCPLSSGFSLCSKCLYLSAENAENGGECTLTRGNHGTTAGTPHDGHPFSHTYKNQ